jgi:uncharacterized protein YukE
MRIVGGREANHPYGRQLGSCGLLEMRWGIAVSAATTIHRLIVTGASGSGKTTVMHHLLHTLPECIVLESDILWGTVPADGPNDFQSYYDLWLRMVKAVAQAGKPALLCGTALPETIERLPERRHIGSIHYLALICDARAQRERLVARPAWRKSGADEFLQTQVRFNQHLRERAAEMIPPMEMLDTTEVTAAETASQVRRWVQSRL